MTPSLGLAYFHHALLSVNERAQNCQENITVTGFSSLDQWGQNVFKKVNKQNGK